jgi:WD40 repeat protein
MQNSTLAEARLDRCIFLETNLRDVNLARYPDLKGHSNIVYSVAFSNDGKYLVSGGWDRLVKLWDIDSHTNVTDLEGHAG